MNIIRHFLHPQPARASAAKAGYCGACSGMLGTPEGIQSLYTYPGYLHLTEEECQKSAHQGCLLCKMIIQYGWANLLEQTKRDAGPLQIVSRKSNYHPSISHRIDLRPDDISEKLSKCFGEMGWLDGGLLTTRSNGNMFWRNVFFFVMLAPPNGPSANHFPETTVCDSFLDDRIMAEATMFLDDCLGGRHEKCTYRGVARLPTRVLDVDPSLGSYVRLRETGVDDHDKYAALSYCWGGPQPLTTLQCNISKMTAGIEINTLPRTLRDAVLVTRRLGIPYLWIDALCIIQDSDEDKLSEIGKMGSIYRNATVTLAAAHARAASDGFLNPCTDHRQASSCLLPVHIPGESAIGHVTLEPQNANLQARATAPLQTRGWTFQEAMLSSRLLVFSKYGLRCVCKVTYQKLLNFGSLPRDVEPGVMNREEWNFEDLEMMRRIHGDNWMHNLYLRELWASVLQEYTHRALTVPSDKLHALQGIVGELLGSPHLAHTIAKTYIAGTWMACVPYLMLWRRADYSIRSPDTTAPQKWTPVLGRSDRAPSWSWASLDCPITFYDLDYKHDYDGFSLIKADENSMALELACHVLSRSKDEFKADQSKASNIHITMDLDVDELASGSTTVYYLHFGKYGLSEYQPVEDVPPICFMLGIVAQENPDGSFGRLGHFKWFLDMPDSNLSLGQRRTVKLL